MLGLLSLFSPATLAAEPPSLASPIISAVYTTGRHRPVRCDRCLPWYWNGTEGKKKKKKGNGLKKRNLSFTQQAHQVTASASPLPSNQAKKDSSRSKVYQEVDFTVVMI